MLYAERLVAHGRPAWRPEGPAADALEMVAGRVADD
jgi:hypothetical protein